MRIINGFCGLVVAVALSLGTMACSDNGGNVDQGVTKDQGAPTPDQGPKAVLDCTKNTCTDFVASDIKMPTDSTTASKYGLVINGQSNNALGQILALLAGQAKDLNLQQSVTDAVNAGSTIVLMRVEADSLSSQPQAAMQTWVGESKTCCTSKTDSAKCASEAKTTCWNGTAEFKPDSKSPADMTFKGSITGSAMSFGPAAMKLTIPLTSQGTLSLNLKAVQIKGKISSSGITEGVLAGAIPKDDLDTVVIPEVAKMVDSTYQDPKTDANTKKMIGDLFDTNSDGKITVAEVKDNMLIKTFLSGDVDVDNDGKKELSLGIGFESVKCKIVQSYSGDAGI